MSIQSYDLRTAGIPCATALHVCGAYGACVWGMGHVGHVCGNLPHGYSTSKVFHFAHAQKALSINIHLSQFCESSHMLCLMVVCSCSHGQGLVWWWWRPSSMAAKPQRACTLPMRIASSMLIYGSFVRMCTCFASWSVALALLTKAWCGGG